jgi:oligosaccharide repeat unit polymerase
LKNDIRILLIPSFYGLISFLSIGILLLLQPIKIYYSLELFIAYIYILIIFSLSLLFNYSILDNNIFEKIKSRLEFSKLDKLFLIVSIIIGFYGIFLYIIDFSVFFGGVTQFFIVAYDDILKIREVQATETSLGFQLSYFSWIALMYLYYILISSRRGFIKNIGILTILILIFILNLLFSDRTRPILLFFSMSMIYIIVNHREIKSVLKLLLFVSLVPLAIFITLALFTGKYDVESGVFNNMLAYLLGGSGYLSEMLGEAKFWDFGFPVNSLYPIAKLFYIFDILEYLPSLNLEFKSVPFETNVGTMMAPLILDGGILMLVLATPIIIFLIDRIALVCLESCTLLGVFTWAIFVFNDIFAPISPKFNNFYMYFFVGIYFLSRLKK